MCPCEREWTRLSARAVPVSLCARQVRRSTAPAPGPTGYIVRVMGKRGGSDISTPKPKKVNAGPTTPSKGGSASGAPGPATPSTFTVPPYVAQVLKKYEEIVESKDIGVHEWLLQRIEALYIDEWVHKYNKIARRTRTWST